MPTHAYHDKNSLYLVIAAIIAIILFFYYGLKFADRSYSRVLGMSNISNNENVIADSPVNYSTLYIDNSDDFVEYREVIIVFFIILGSCGALFAYFGYHHFLKGKDKLAKTRRKKAVIKRKKLTR